MRELGLRTVRFNFRGVGASEGHYDEGVGETEDLLAVVDWARRRWPDSDLWLAGFLSFAGQSRDLGSLADEVAGTSAELDAAISAAREATDGFLEWLRAEAPSNTA